MGKPKRDLLRKAPFYAGRQVVVPRAQVVVSRAQVVVSKTCGFTRRRSSSTTILVSLLHRKGERSEPSHWLLTRWAAKVGPSQFWADAAGERHAAEDLVAAGAEAIAHGDVVSAGASVGVG